MENARRRSRRGSIPACAGEPRRSAMPPSTPRVYPRVCGGTDGGGHLAAHWQGLSPRVRGNHLMVYVASRKQGSIPACAGEPGVVKLGRVAAQAYPRVCGGTGDRNRLAMSLSGLSPRVRGNQRESPPDAQFRGSIPACAGEPPGACPSWGSSGVYPRVCGGTRPTDSPTTTPTGLSPRVRGNLLFLSRPWSLIGSIPACAGEPPGSPRPTTRSRVYPRVCGGTAGVEPDGLGQAGLSPRVRGNRLLRGVVWVRVGSIPACAGEPGF